MESDIITCIYRWEILKGQWVQSDGQQVSSRENTVGPNQLSPPVFVGMSDLRGPGPVAQGKWHSPI